jgi:hypothetical protein
MIKSFGLLLGAALLCRANDRWLTFTATLQLDAPNTWHTHNDAAFQRHHDCSTANYRVSFAAHARSQPERNCFQNQQLKGSLDCILMQNMAHEAIISGRL